MQSYSYLLTVFDLMLQRYDDFVIHSLTDLLIFQPILRILQIFLFYVGKIV